MKTLIEDAQALYHTAVRSVQADLLVASANLEAWLGQPLEDYRRVVVVGAGKASMAMAGAVEARLKTRIDGGLVVVPHGYRATLPSSQRQPTHIEVLEAGHPVPDAAGVAATERVLALVEACGEDDLILVLISGGGSALWPSPAVGLTLGEMQVVSRLLLRSGADIHQVNTVRKHLSRIKGGQLAAAAFPAQVLALVISDVVGDDLSVIASGPTVPDETTYGDAIKVLESFKLWQAIPESVRHHLEQGQQGHRPETPSAEADCYARVQTVLLGSNQIALEAMRAEARKRGYHTEIVAHDAVGEAREVGRNAVRKAMTLAAGRSACLLWGGETTVTVTGTGRGGRNQEVALAAALALEGNDRPFVLLSGGTDGIDGPTPAAGAWVTPQTASDARAQGDDPAAFLAENDAYTFFSQNTGLLVPGPTHTNVMDVLLVLVRT